MNDFQEKFQSLKNQQNSYDKEHKTFDEQLKILHARNLIVSNYEYAITKLQHINYYRLSAYFLPFQHKKSSVNKNQFLPNTTFENIIKIYYFDTELRKIVFEAIEVIEIYFRTQIAYYHGQQYKPYGYLDKENFKTNQEFYDKIINTLKDETQRANEEFISHFETKYKTTDLPIWTLVEVISFGTLSKIYSILKTQEQKDVIHQLKGINNTVFKNWLHSLSVVRNICAHHSRLWNKTLGVKFEVPNKMVSFKTIKNENSKYLNDKIFFALSVIEYLLSCIGEDEIGFKGKIKQLLQKYPNIDKKAMGFVDDWEELEMWR
jgi:abortive infection bacteriophage resistance protein